MELQEVLDTALADERRAATLYEGVVARFGVGAPFASIAGAERRHEAALLWHYDQLGLTPPPDESANQVTVAPTLLANAEAAVIAEYENGRMYDDLIAVTEEESVKETFYHLQAAAWDNHLPAFRRLVANLQTANPDDLLAEVQALMQEPDPQKLTGLITGPNGPLLSGALVGMGAVWLLNNLNTKDS